MGCDSGLIQFPLLLQSAEADNFVYKGAVTGVVESIWNPSTREAEAEVPMHSKVCWAT